MLGAAAGAPAGAAAVAGALLHVRSGARQHRQPAAHRGARRRLKLHEAGRVVGGPVQHRHGAQVVVLRGARGSSRSSFAFCFVLGAQKRCFEALERAAALCRNALPPPLPCPRLPRPRMPPPPKHPPAGSQSRGSRAPRRRCRGGPRGCRGPTSSPRPWAACRGVARARPGLQRATGSGPGDGWMPVAELAGCRAWAGRPAGQAGAGQNRLSGAAAGGAPSCPRRMQRSPLSRRKASVTSGPNRMPDGGGGGAGSRVGRLPWRRL